jgi:hypothetical protein
MKTYMSKPTQLKNATILSAKTLIGRPSLRLAFILIPLVLACFALSPTARALLPPPPPDGGYPGSNTAEGTQALQSLTTGVWNTALGFQTLSSDTIGSSNTATGVRSLSSNFDGANNTATGVFALTDNTSGRSNTASGVNALVSNTTGSSNTAVGVNALFHNNAGFQTAVGRDALFANTTGSQNVAIGYTALAANRGGNSSTAVGFQALGVANAAQNTAVGHFALGRVTTGFGNTALGDAAGPSLTTGNFNVYIGAFASGAAGESNTTRISNIYTTVQPVAGTDPDVVTVDSHGRLGRGNQSSRRYKHDIKLMEKASEAIFKLKPVSFRYKEEFDSTQTLAFGLIAEQVAEVYPDLVGRNPEGQPESVRYEQINAMLLNEFLKEDKTVQEQGVTIAALKKEIAALTATLKEQALQIQNVSAQLEASKPAPQVVLNSQ